MKWLEIEEKLPKSGQEVLIYYYDEVSERDEIILLTYFNKGEVMYTRIDRNPKLSKAKRFLNTLFDKNLEVKAEEDGFYIFEWGADGDTQTRKHKDCITHWMELPIAPCKELS